MTPWAPVALDTVSLPNICNFHVCDFKKMTARERFLREEKEKSWEKKVAEVTLIALASEQFNCTLYDGFRV